MALSASVTRMRRFLRDPDSAIWTDADLMAWWNEAQIELAQKTSLLERCEVHYYPPRYSYAYMWDWEYTYIDGDIYHPCLCLHQPSIGVNCYPWEAGYWLDTVSTPDDGDRYTQPWEIAYCSPAEPAKVPLHRKCDNLKFAAYDEVRIDPLSEREVAGMDGYYKTRTGQVTNYYRPDSESNQIVLYPTPSSIVFQEEDDADIFDDDGGLLVEESETESDDFGISTNVIDSDDALFFAYTYIPTDVTDWTDSSEDWPDWFLKYIEYGTLERAFGADTDGYIPSLRDYWKLRKEIGIKALQKFWRMRGQDRDYRLGMNNRPTRGRGGSLGAHYPAI